MPDSLPPCSVSIICPVRNEAAHIEALLYRLRALRHAERLLCEIIVSDGGSTDDTVARAHAAGASVVTHARGRGENNRIFASQISVVTHARGRGPQLNAGAAVARGRVLWFLHADARPHPLALRTLERAHRAGYRGGNFRLKFAAHGLWPRAFEWIARGQRRIGVAYGDSGFWVSRASFASLAGFATWPLFEDYDFWRRMHRAHRVYHARLPLWVSARRIQHEPQRVLLLWLRLQLAFWRGVSPHELSRRYHP